MGQAKARGTLEERQAEGIKKKKEREKNARERIIRLRKPSKRTNEISAITAIMAASLIYPSVP